MVRLPTLERLENSVQPENQFIPDHQKVAKELEPLIKLIDFKRIKAQILIDIIKPLEIIPTEMILKVYRDGTKSGLSDIRETFYFRNNMNNIRGTLYFWD